MVGRSSPFSACLRPVLGIDHAHFAHFAHLLSGNLVAAPMLLWLIPLLGLLVAGCSCNERPIPDEPPPIDIEGMCHTYCERVMECLWTPDLGVAFSTVEGCEDTCRSDMTWDRCPQERTDVLECVNSYACPEFAAFGRGCHDDDPATGQCCEEIHAFSGACA